MASETNGATGAVEQHYLLFVWGGVEPELHGPYATDDDRLEAARALADDGGSDDHGLFRLDVTGPVEVSSFGAAEVGEASY
ncbi:MAG: hypothetical protein OXI50_08090 [Gammaproteobacteria bacterium]|nr:hypothetical protein [Gammaproteobacteria bacterium]